MKKAKMMSCAIAIAMATSVGIASEAYAEKYDPSVAIMATALPTEEPEQVAEEEKVSSMQDGVSAIMKERKEQVVLCSCDYMKCVCGTTDQEVVEQKPSMKDKIAAIMNENKGQDQSEEVLYAANGVKKGNLYIPKDTVVTLKLIEPIHSKKVKKGTSFRLETVDNLVINDVVIIPKGQEVLGKVLEARGSRAMGGSGKLEINIPQLETINGVQIPVDGYVYYKGRSDGGAGVVFAAVSMVGGLFMKGKNVEFMEGQLFNVTVNKDTDLEATPDNLAEVMSKDKRNVQSITVSVAE